MIYKAISIQGPWWWAILHAGKDVENRTWPFPLPTPCRLVIHAGKKIDPEGLLYLTTGEIRYPANLPTGCLVGEITVTGQFRHQDHGGYIHTNDKWAFGPYCWTLADPVAYETPIPYRGQLRIFEVEM